LAVERRSESGGNHEFAERRDFGKLISPRWSKGLKRGTEPTKKSAAGKRSSEKGREEKFLVFKQGGDEKFELPINAERPGKRTAMQ